MKKKIYAEPFHCGLIIIIINKIRRKTKKKSESTALTHQIRLTHQT